MEEIKQVLSLFDTVEKWNSYIELSNMREALVNELKTRLYKEICNIGDEKLKDSGWCFDDNNNINVIRINPEGTKHIGIAVEFCWWNYNWGHRSAFIWINEPLVDITFLKQKILQYRTELPLQDYEENNQHGWLPYVKKIPARVFDVSDEVISPEMCLFRAINNSKELAEDMWRNVYEPFASKHIANIMKSFITSVP